MRSRDGAGEVPDTVVPSELVDVEYALLEFPPGQTTFPAEVADELALLSDAGLINVLDLLVVQKAFDGSVDGFEVDDLEVDTLGGLESDVAVVLAERDVRTLSAIMQPGTVAGVVVWENLWVSRLSSVASRVGGHILAVGTIPVAGLLQSFADSGITEGG
jgi:hypothetical protein